MVIVGASISTWSTTSSRWSRGQRLTRIASRSAVRKGSSVPKAGSSAMRTPRSPRPRPPRRLSPTSATATSRPRARLVAASRPGRPPSTSAARAAAASAHRRRLTAARPRLLLEPLVALLEPLLLALDPLLALLDRLEARSHLGERLVDVHERGRAMPRVVVGFPLEAGLRRFERLLGGNHARVLLRAEGHGQKNQGTESERGAHGGPPCGLCSIPAGRSPCAGKSERSAGRHASDGWQRRLCRAARSADGLRVARGLPRLLVSVPARADHGDSGRERLGQEHDSPPDRRARAAGGRTGPGRRRGRDRALRAPALPRAQQARHDVPGRRAPRFAHGLRESRLPAARAYAPRRSRDRSCRAPPARGGRPCRRRRSAARAALRRDDAAGGARAGDHARSGDPPLRRAVLGARPRVGAAHRAAAAHGEHAARQLDDRGLAPHPLDAPARRPRDPAPAAAGGRREPGGAAAKPRSGGRGVPRRGPGRAGRRRGGAVMVGLVQELGWLVLRFVEDLGKLARCTAPVVRAARTPPVRVRLFVTEVFKPGVRSLVISCVSGLAVGMVLGLQGYNTLVRFGAEQSLGAVVGLSLIRELGPVLTGLLATGRAGSATAAEIGTMVATEQLDGLRMMSIDPIDLVVTPKAAAMIFVMPLLSALFICCGLFGGYLVGVVLMGLDGGVYMSSLQSAVDFHDDVLGSVLKALLFGTLVGLIATYRGYSSAPTSAGVSAATTTTVVVASVSILIFDYFFTALWGV